MSKKNIVSQTIFSGDYSPNRIDSVVFLPDRSNFLGSKGLNLSTFNTDLNIKHLGDYFVL